LKRPALIKSFFLLFFLAIFFTGAGNSAEAAARKSLVTGIKHWSNPDYTRVVIQLNRKAEFNHRLLKQDPLIKMEWRRLYIDFSDSVISPRMDRAVPINDGLLKAARAGQYDPTTVRVVLDIESIEDYKIFPLSDPFRIVIDVSGVKKATAPPAQPILDSSGKEVPQIRQSPAITPTPDPTLIQQLGLKVRTIVIDPGHGGKDPGAIGRGGLREKDVTLKLGLMLREKLTREAGARTILTRDADVFIPLEERTAIANSQDADIFVSIHINASPRRAASGIETYILSLSKNEEARRLAARENATSTRSVSDLEFILNDLIKTAKTNDSARLAAVVQDNLVDGLKKKYSGISSHGVKGAPFYVLVGTKMPAILVEVSFISNPDDEQRLRDEAYLREVVDGISSGIMHYINGSGAV